MRVGVVVEQHSGVEQAGRVDEPLDLAHHLIELVAVLPPHERSHDATRAVFGLERAPLPEHEVDHVGREALIARKPLGGVETLVEQEVKVAVFRVPEDHRVLVALALEQRDEPFARGLEPLDRHRDVFEQRRRARGSAARDGREQPLAQVPQLSTRARVAAERGRRLFWIDGCCAEGPHPLQLREHGFGGRDARAERLCRLALKLDQQRCVPLDREGAQLERRFGVDLRDPQAGCIEQFDRREAQRDESRQRGSCRAEVVKDEKARGHVRADRHGTEDRVCHEGERALAADHQAQQQLDRVVVVEKRVEAVSHRVLDRVQSRERRDRGWVAAHSITQSLETGDELGAGIRQLRERVGRRRVDDRAVGEHEHCRLERAIRVGGDAARHAARVVGDDAADRAGDLARRVGAKLATVPREAGVDRAHGGAGAAAHPASVVEHGDAAKVPAGVEQ